LHHLSLLILPPLLLLLLLLLHGIPTGMDSTCWSS
jgi:hypothetical protein